MLRTSRAVGKSVRTVRNIQNDFKRAAESGGKVSTPRKIRKSKQKMVFDDFNKSVVRMKFLEYYEAKEEIPTLNKLLSAVKKEINFKGSKTTF